MPSGSNLHPLIHQVCEDLVSGVGIDDIEDLLVPFQALPEIGGEQGPVLFLVVIDTAEMIPRPEVHYRAYQ
jgi:hypothetical protein